jgi:hypothetical protein
MTNTPIPRPARRSIVELANSEFSRIEDFAFQIAMDNCQELPASDDDDENEETERQFAFLILRQIAARIYFQAMLLSTEVTE